MIRTILDGLMAPEFLGLMAKVTLVLTAGFAIAATLRRRAAALRHLIWLLSLAGALLVVALAPIAPRLDLPLLRTAASARPALGETPRPAPRASFSVMPALLPAPGLPAFGRDLEVAPARRASLDSRTVLFALWGLGAAAVLLWCLLGHFGLARLAASGHQSPNWQAIERSARVAMPTRQEVRFGTSAGVGAPVTWGWPRAMILMPASARSWPQDRVLVAMRHELAHVARQDYLAQLLATIACAVLWFHPLAWMAARRLRSESEHACDDLVLRGGCPAPDYASHLLEVARGERAMRLSGIVAVGMARRSHLEGRLLAILDERRLRQAVPGRVHAGLLIVLAGALVPLAGLHLTTAAAHPRDPEAKAALAADEDRVDEQRSEEVEPGGLLSLDLDTGGKVILRGWDERRVVVRAKLAGRDADDTRVSVDHVNGGVEVKSKFVGERWNRSTSHTFEIQVPRRFNVHITSAGGDLDFRGVEGDFRGETGGGGLVLANLKGSLHLSTGGGDIHVSDSDLSGHVSTGGGMVRLSRVRGGLRGSSGSGPVIYSEPGDSRDSKGDLGDLDASGDNPRITNRRSGAEGMLHIDKAGGDVDLDEAPEGAVVSTGGGEIRVGPAAVLVDAHTGGGDVEVGPVAGCVTASTGAGAVHVILANSKGGDQTVKITSGTGRIILDVPWNLDVDFQLETAYTRDHGPTEIRSDFALDRTVTQDWDDSRGTPRRYVRASGTNGNGHGKIRVSTVNGDIEVHRLGRGEAR